jgi:hypothetical protein
VTGAVIQIVTRGPATELFPHWNVLDSRLIQVPFERQGIELWRETTVWARTDIRDNLDSYRSQHLSQFVA